MFYKGYYEGYYEDFRVGWFESFFVVSGFIRFRLSFLGGFRV